MCDKALDTCGFVFDSVPDQYMTQEICDIVLFKKSFMLKYCYRYNTPRMCNKAVECYLLALQLVPVWFVTSTMIEKTINTVFSNDDIVFGDIDSDIVTFFSIDIGLNCMNLNNVNIDDDNFGDYDPETINHFRLMAWYNRYEQHKIC